MHRQDRDSIGSGTFPTPHRRRHPLPGTFYGIGLIYFALVLVTGSKTRSPRGFGQAEKPEEGKGEAPFTSEAGDRTRAHAESCKDVRVRAGVHLQAGLRNQLELPRMICLYRYYIISIR